MNKTELIESLSRASGESKASAQRVLDCFIDTVAAEMAAGREVALPGFGSFKVGARAERQGRNPRTGEAITIAAARVVKFVPGSTLRTAVNPAEPVAEDER